MEKVIRSLNLPDEICSDIYEYYKLPYLDEIKSRRMRIDAVILVEGGNLCLVEGGSMSIADWSNLELRICKSYYNQLKFYTRVLLVGTLCREAKREARSFFKHHCRMNRFFIRENEPSNMLVKLLIKL